MECIQDHVWGLPGVREVADSISFLLFCLSGADAPETLSLRACKPPAYLPSPLPVSRASSSVPLPRPLSLAPRSPPFALASPSLCPFPVFRCLAFASPVPFPASSLSPPLTSPHRSLDCFFFLICVGPMR